VGTHLHVYACVRSSDTDVLCGNLASSPAIARGGVGLTILWNQKTAASAYARAMETATADILVFTHSDVYFAEGWFERLEWEVDRLTQMDEDWAAASISGMTASGELVGQMWDCSLVPLFPDSSGIYGKALSIPVPIVSLDESAFIVRRRAGVNFDPLVPDFHLYGTDIVLQAERQGKRSYGLDIPILHNAKAGLRTPREFVRSYKYMIRKWRHRLPLKTPYCVLTNNPFWLPLRSLRVRYKAIFRSDTYSTRRISNPCAKANELGISELLLRPIIRERVTQSELKGLDPAQAQQSFPNTSSANH
jgi:hypothetical protein